MAIPYSENPAFQAAACASERLLQQDLGPQNLQDNSGIPGRCTVPAPPLSAAAVRAATVAHYRRLIAAAQANGVSPASYLWRSENSPAAVRARGVERSLVMSVIHSENATHKATLLVAEQTLQAALANATAAQAKTATLAFYRTARASAIANGLSPHQFSCAIREICGQDS
jgi:hypothetical protein